jgi:hypothetical protein
MQMQAAARERAETEFSVDVVVREYLSVYSAVLGKSMAVVG